MIILRFEDHASNKERLKEFMHKSRNAKCKDLYQYSLQFVGRCPIPRINNYRR